jgi:ATP-binding cassette subfamily B protein
MHRPSHSDLEIVRRYTDQPTGLSLGLRHAVEAAWGGEPIQLYALADLDASMRLCEAWLCLGPSRVAVVEPGVAGASPEILSFERSRVCEVRQTPGLSCGVLSILGGPGEPPLARLRYTNRQRRAIERLAVALEPDGTGVDPSGLDADSEYVEGLARPIRDAQALVAHRRIGVLWRLLAYLRPYRRQVALGMGAALLVTLCALVPPYVSGRLIDTVIEPAQSGALDPGQGALIAWFALAGLAGVYLLRQLCNWIRLRLMSVLGEFVARDLRTELYEHLQELSLSFFSRKKTGTLITRVSADTDRLWEFLALGVVDVSLAIATLIGLGAVLIYLDWRLGLLMTLPVPILCGAIALHGSRLNRLFLRAWRKWSSVTDVLSDTIPGMRVVKAFNQEEREKRRFGERNHDVVGEFNRIHATWTTFWPALLMSVHILVLAVWVLAIPRLLGSDAATGPTLSAGTFVSFLLYMTMFVAPIEIIGQMARIMNRATSSAHRVFEVLDTRPDLVDCERPVKLEPLRGRVSFENVTFAYDSARQILKGISFEVSPGEMVGLVGPSGGGKSTIVSLIARFYDVTGGCIRIDDVDVRELDAGHYRAQIGMVLQDPYLFFGTILDNIRYGMPEASADRVVQAAIAANAHDFVCKLEHGYDTLVGERGQSLSGGERQRISIARAILHDPRILILDEATSSVDTETEWKIQEALWRLIAGRTVFAIAHRLSTLKRADRLLVIEDGRIAEQGTHSELLARPGGTYATLHGMQLRLQDGI